ncbi:germinal-center associated nuclear protein-like [Rhagoletis pomonella]|uniref:germinal-center associated nuclear protein-like n=1 Tax=Rhagoletis pomonella TaxID=28610 RepID=UPI00177C0E94|nr:germinal-center associated nuclear protein-like [Rhagoletis pomonella]
MSNSITGTCDFLCPEVEAKLRIKERLLHFYEWKNGEKNVPGMLVKSFVRSAAGVRAPRAKDLRTERCLQKTVEYLLKDIILDKRRPYNFAYDFIFDRLRAVRQEVVMQQYNERQTLKLLEPMVMFLAYSRYRLCEDQIDNFDTKICNQHLQECLKRALCCYDDINVNSMKLNELRKRNLVEAIYLLFNLGTIDALNRALSIPQEVRKSETFDLAYKIAISYHQGNFYRVLSGIQKLPHILSAIAALKLQILRRKVYLVFAHAYTSRQLVVPAIFLSKLVIHEHIDDLLADCKYYNIHVSEDKASIHFLKSDFNLNAAVLKERHERFVEKEIDKIYLPEILLLKCL